MNSLHCCHLQVGELKVLGGIRKNVRLHMPMALVCSQLPYTVKFPVKISLLLLEQQAAGVTVQCAADWCSELVVNTNQ